MKNNKGFTLVELCASIALTVVAVVVLIEIFTFTMNSYQSQVIKNEQSVLVTEVEELVIDQLRYASTIVVANGLTSGEEDYNTLYTDGGGLYYNDKLVAGGDLHFGEALDVRFLESEGSSIRIQIYVDDGNGRQTTHEVACRLVNMEIHGMEPAIDTSSNGKKVFYQ